MRALLVSLVVASTAMAQTTSKAPMSAEDVNTLLYGLGVSLAKDLDALALSPEELELVLTGLKEGHAGTARAGAAVGSPRIRELEVARKQARLGNEKARGRAFAEQAAAQAKVSPTATGLVYIVRQEGKGKNPGPTDVVRVHYRGSLVDGREFDSSYTRGKPAEFALDQVIPCWTEGMQKMKPGGKATLVCPSAVGYGDKGNPGIPPGATLVFEVELLEVRASGKGFR